MAACAVVVTVAVAAVGVLGLLGSRSLWGIGLALAVLYAGYYAVLAPYWSRCIRTWSPPSRAAP